MTSQSAPNSTQPLTSQQIIHATRMYDEANARLHDAAFMEHSGRAQSDSASIIRVLAFEVLLKCALHLRNRPRERSHDYVRLWGLLSAPNQEEILNVARCRMPGHADLSELDELLADFKRVFDQARYYYELSEGETPEEHQRKGELWQAQGGRPEEAEIRYQPNELTCLIAGLSSFIERRISPSPSSPGSV